jgi:GGDEF domain-containing protein
MEVPRQPPDEEARLNRLRSLGLLDSPPDERFDRITRLACRLFDVPQAAVMLVDADREWPLSAQGLPRDSAPRASSLSAHALHLQTALVLPDVHADPRYAPSAAAGAAATAHVPMVPRFFAGVPLRLGAEPSALGTLCLMDRWPRAFAAVDEAVLRDLADLVQRELQGVLQSLSDGSTGLSNPQAFEQLGQQALRLCARAHAPAALLRFRLLPSYRDAGASASWSPEALEGDREAAARQFARLLRATFRASDVLARMSSQGFAALVTHCSEPYLKVVIERLQRAVRVYNDALARDASGRPELHFTVDVRALTPTSHTTLEQLMSFDRTELADVDAAPLDAPTSTPGTDTRRPVLSGNHAASAT